MQSDFANTNIILWFVILFVLGPTLILGYLGITGASLYLFGFTFKKIQRQKIELRSSMHAITPLLLAERDREYVNFIVIINLYYYYY